MAEPAAELNHSPPAAELPVQLPGRLVGIAYRYDDLVELVRARVRELNITQSEMDLICGLPQGYSGKILARPPVRKLGALSLSCILAALGLALVVAVDDAQTLKIRPRLEQRKKPLLSRPHWRYWRKGAHPASL